MKYDVRKVLTRKEVDVNFTDYDIFNKYIPGFRLGKLINSPLREDSHPSFSTYKSNNRIRFRDFSNGMDGNALEFVKQLFKLDNIKEVFDKLKEEFTGYKSTNYIPPTESKDIGIVRQAFTKVDLSYWKQYGITIDTLRKFNVFSIKYFLVNKTVRGTYCDEKPLYAYTVFDRFKIYSPLTDKFHKWRGNLTNYDLQGYEQLPESGEILFITKSLKDVMTLYELGYVAVAPPSETATIPKEIIADLKARFKRIIVLYDRDRAGVINARNIVRVHALDFYFVPRVYNSKDISDCVRDHGASLAKQLLQKKVQT